MLLHWVLWVFIRELRVVVWRQAWCEGKGRTKETLVPSHRTGNCHHHSSTTSTHGDKYEASRPPWRAHRPRTEPQVPEGADDKTAAPGRELPDFSTELPLNIIVPAVLHTVCAASFTACEHF